jgi:hypothetical protein
VDSDWGHAATAGIVFATLLAACGGGGAGAGPDAAATGGPTGSVADYTAALEAVLCSDEAGACCAPRGARVDLATCRTNVAFSVTAMKDLVATSGVVEPAFNAAAASACLDLMRAVVASCARFVPNTIMPPCGAIFSPAADGGAPGTSCHLAADCTQPPNGTAWCDVGSCKVHPDAFAGDACRDDGDCRPAGSLVCAADAKTCRPRAAAGGACADPWECLDGSSGCLAGQCVGPAAAGDACLTASVGYRGCGRGLRCLAGSCTTALAAGSACAAAPDTCEDGALCVPLPAGKVCVWQTLLGACTVM